VEIDERSLRISTKQLAAEIFSQAPESVVAYRGTHRWTRSFEPIRLEEQVGGGGPWRDNGVYLITGGLGRIGVAIAEHIARHADATIVLVGRSGPSFDSWANGDDRHEGSGDDLLGRLRRLQSVGTKLHVMRGDVSDRDEMVGIVNEVRRRFGGLHGVVHAAGALKAAGFATLRKPATTAFKEQFGAKVYGLYVLEQALASVVELEFCLLLSSLSAHLGGLEHAAYAAANRFMDAFARRRESVAGPRWISVDSELWHFGDQPAALDQQRPGLGASLEGLAMSPAEAMATIDGILCTGGLVEVAISTCELNTRYRQWAVGESSTRDAVAKVDEPQRVHERSKSFVDYIPPRNAQEQHVASVWAEILGFDQVGIEDDFFQLGGHSISAIRIVARLRSALGVELSVADLLTNPTIARLSTVIPERAERLAEA
jgi:NAD(P)-dependent dehydrogenase (short-subunit alcohol dehydrogenase family)/acyl carrier protein